MNIAVAKRMQDTREYYFSTKLREIDQMNRDGLRVLNLGIGSPDLAPPQVAIEKLAASCAVPAHHGYQSYKGIPALRQAFADWYHAAYGVTINPDNEILPLIGSKEGIFHISMTYLDEGDEVLVPNPGYPAYASATKLTGARTVLYDLEEDAGWLPDLQKLSRRDLSKVKIMWVNYPNMPTGAKAGVSFLKDLIAFGKENGILICNDNPYSFILNDHPQSLLSVEGAMDTALELNSLSKSHNMAGWRMGMVAGSAENLQHILRFKSNIDSGMFLPVQEAAVEALQYHADWYKELNKAYGQRRVIVWKIMDLLGCSFRKDQSGLFIWAKVPDKVPDVEAWADTLLHQARVFITPGFIFGSNGSRFIRISLCNKESILEEALERIQSVSSKQLTALSW